MADSERLYYPDSFLRSFTATVTEVREIAGRDEGSAWRLTLNRTAFYPTSGGQPFDTGVLRAVAPSGAQDIRVEQVEEDEDGSVWHFVQTPVAAGTDVQGQIDWERRFDHMQQHTGQHLLSAVFWRELQAATVSFHLGETSSTIDLSAEMLARHSLERVERIANEIIGEDRQVNVQYVPRQEAEQLLAAGDLRKLPDREGTIRLIEIAELDRNACGGTHVRSTGQIGGLLVRRVEKVSRGVRVEFVCGLRAVRTARQDATVLAETAGLLSIGAPELPATVQRLLAESKAGAKERQKLREQLASYEAQALSMETPIENGLRLVLRGWKDRDRDYVKMLASQTAKAGPATAVMLFAAESDPIRVFVARSRDLSFDCGRILKEALAQLGLRGGGSPDLAQGDVPAKQEPTLRDMLIDSIRKSVSPH